MLKRVKCQQKIHRILEIIIMILDEKNGGYQRLDFLERLKVTTPKDGYETNIKIS